LENLDEFEPHRWFGKLRRKPDNGKNGNNGKNGKEAKDEEGGFSSIDATANGDEEAGNLPVVERSELAPGWVVDEPILSIGGRSPLDEAAAAILAEVLNKRGLATKALPAEAISAGHIASLANTEAKLVCLSYLGLGAGPALIRYLVRRLRRILPEGVAILVCYWKEEGNKAATKAMLETAEADAYATTLPEAIELCVKAAKGELKREQAEDTVSAAPSPSGDKPKRRAPKRKPQSAAA
jgi:hypothetical protein